MKLLEKKWKTDALLAANRASSFEAFGWRSPQSPFQPTPPLPQRRQVSPLSEVRKTEKVPATGSPIKTPLVSDSPVGQGFENLSASQNPSLSGLLKTSFHVWQASVVL